MAEVAIRGVLTKLGEVAVRETNIQIKVDSDIILLRDRLEWLHAVVCDADRKRRAGTVDGLTRVWVRQTRDVAFAAEDALDDFFHEVVGPKDKGLRGFFKALHKYSVGLCAKVLLRRGLSCQIKIISSRLDQISKNQKEYKIVHAPSVSSAYSTTAIAAWRDDMDYAVGFDEHVCILMDMLGSFVEKNEEEHSIYSRQKKRKRANKQIHNPVFVSIVGESGAGKTTLARIICRMMTDEHKLVVWYGMEPGSSTEDVLTEVYRRAYWKLAAQRGRQLEPETSSEDIGDKLRSILRGTSYLLILGGISSKTIINSIRASLPDPEPEEGIETVEGGRVMLILDTENEEVAWHANTMNRDHTNRVHLLTRLDKKRSGQLFFWKVLRKPRDESLSSDASRGKEISTSRSLVKETEQIREIEGIEEEGREQTREIEEKKEEEKADRHLHDKLVHEITGGYPMAIVLLAGLLRFKEKPVQWNAVLQQLKSGNNRAQDGGEGLSNGQMCGTRRATEMVFWASFEELPNDLKSCFLYFASYPTGFSHPADELVRMWIGEGFIKPQKGKTMEEVGHDFLKELVLRCLVELFEIKGMWYVRVHKSLMGFLRWEVREAGFMEIHDIHDVIVPSSVRRLSVQSDNCTRRYATTFVGKKFPQLRSFICHINDQQQHEHDLEFLRWSRFLHIISVQGLSLTELPEQIDDMIQLRYLRVDSRSLLLLPSSIAKLLNLQTLDIRSTQVQVIHNDFWKIKRLRHVLASNLTLSRTMSVMDEDQSGGGSELQTLHGVTPIASEMWSEGNCPLDKMTNLRSLEMHGFIYEKHSGPAFEDAIGNMPLLGHLKLQGDEIPSCVLTDPRLRSLQTVVLDGTVKWEHITSEVLRKVRPNLVQLILNQDIQVPQEIKDHLGTILVQ